MQASGLQFNLSPNFLHLFLCLYIQFLFERVQGVSKATIIDLDAHQVSSLPVFSAADVLFKIEMCDTTFFPTSMNCQLRVNHR